MGEDAKKEEKEFKGRKLRKWANTPRKKLQKEQTRVQSFLDDLGPEASMLDKKNVLLKSSLPSESLNQHIQSLEHEGLQKLFDKSSSGQEITISDIAHHVSARVIFHKGKRQVVFG